MNSPEFSIRCNAPLSIKNLYREAAGCLEQDYLTGSSACINLLSIELVEHMELEGGSFEERIMVLRDNTGADSKLFESMLMLDRYKEEGDETLSYDGWNKSQLQHILRAFSQIVEEYYPASR